MPGLFLHNARIWTGVPGAPRADCAVVEDGAFRFVGRATDLNPRPDMATIDAADRFFYETLASAFPDTLLWVGDIP